MLTRLGSQCDRFLRCGGEHSGNLLKAVPRWGGGWMFYPRGSGTNRHRCPEESWISSGFNCRDQPDDIYCTADFQLPPFYVCKLQETDLCFHDDEPLSLPAIDSYCWGDRLVASNKAGCMNFEPKAFIFQPFEAQNSYKFKTSVHTSQ
jgi:hypothetical protein